MADTTNIPEKTTDNSDSKNKPSGNIPTNTTDGAKKHGPTIAVILAVVLLYILTGVEWYLFPESRIWILHTFGMLSLVSIVLLWMIVKDKLVKNNIGASSVSEETHLTPDGVFVSRILVPLFYAIAGVIVFVIALWQLDAQSVATRDLLGEIKGQNEKSSAAHEALQKTLSEQLESQIKTAQFQVTIQHLSTAITNLGSDNQAVVLGGIHVLNLLAMQNDEYRERVFDILCNFIREETTRPEYQARIPVRSDNNKPEPPKNRASLGITQTIVNKLFLEESSRNYYKGFKVNLRGASLHGINFNSASGNLNWQEADLQGVSLERAYLQEANLRAAKMQEADLSDAKLQKAKLVNAELEEANLGGAELQEADLSNAKLQGATLGNAKLQKAILNNANLQGAYLGDTNLQGAFLIDAKLQYVDLCSADLHGTDLRGADLRGVILSDTKLHETKIDKADFRGAHTTHHAFINAAKEGIGLNTDLSGIILYDAVGNKFDLTEDQKKEWFREQGANIDDLTAEEVQQLAEELGYPE